MQTSTLSYSEQQKLFKNKFKDYTIAQCNFAINDIDETLSIWKHDDMTNPYVLKLVLEREEAINRKYKQQKV